MSSGHTAIDDLAKLLPCQYRVEDGALAKHGENLMDDFDLYSHLSDEQRIWAISSTASQVVD
jgi:hypothetical protein